MGIGVDLVYGVSQEALAYTTKIPPESSGHAFEIVTDQLSLNGKVRTVKYTAQSPRELANHDPRLNMPST